MKQTDQTHSLQELVHRFLEASPFQEKLTTAKARAIWHTTMPASTCTRTEKIYIYRNKLFLKITSAVLRHELQFNKANILSLFQKRIPNALSDIVFL